MNEKTLHWDDLHLFIAVAREKGLSPAARATGLSAATLGRRMQRLERSLGRELFVRHDRGYELTADARALLKDLTDVEARITRLNTPSSENARPLVKISAGTWTTLSLLDKLGDITGRPADVRLRFLSVESILDISRREAVIGFRNRRPTEESLAGRKLSRVEFAPYARDDAPDQWIKVLSDTPSARWLDKKIGKDAVCEVTAPRNSLDLALAGLGIAVLPTFVGERHMTLDRRGGAISELAHDRWMVTHKDDRFFPEVRRTLDRLVTVLGGRE